MNPKIKTGIAVTVPVLLSLGTLVFHDRLSLYVQALALVLVAAAAVANVFHVSAGTVSVLQALVAALQSPTPGATPPAPVMAKARRLAALPAAAIVLLVVLLPGCGNVPSANQPTNLIAPGLACAEEAVLDLLGSPDPNAIAGACAKFGAVAASDVVGIAATLLKQQTPPPTGSAASPLYVRLGRIAAWKPQ